MIDLTLTPAQASWLEATWCAVTQAPDVDVPYQPAVLDADGLEIEAEVAATTKPGDITRTELRHTSYHPTQIAALRSAAEEIGTPLTNHEGMLAQWVENYVAPEPEPVKVPNEVSIRQACLALEGAGLLDDVEAVVATLPKVYQIEWQRASVVLRSNPLVEIVRQQNSMTEAQIDALFIQAELL